MKDNLLVESLKYVYNEHKMAIKTLPSLIVENMHQQTLRTSLGIGWVFFRDFVYYIAFIIFRYLMSGSGTVDGMNFIMFLMLGLIPWNFMNECINGAVTAINTNKWVLASIKFPIVVLPTIEVLGTVLKRLFTLLILFGIVIVFGDIKDVTWWIFIYYFICMIIFMLVWNLVFSSLVAISNDFEQLYRAFTSVIFFAMPIMWSFETLRPYPWIIRIFKLNPFVYIIEGMRSACVSLIIPDREYTIYFWVITIILFCIGSVLQYKLKSHYVDLI